MVIGVQVARGFILSEADVRAVKGLLAEAARRRQNPTGRPRVDLDDSQAPEVYVALSPTGGIDGLREGVGTGTGTGTGTISGSGDEPGYADCYIYQTVINVSTPELMPVSGLFLRVYNLSTVAIPGRSWIIVARDKFGDWYAICWQVATASGGGSSAFSGALIYNNAFQDVVALGTGTYNLTTLTEEYDTDGYHSAASFPDRMTVPSNGKYLIGGTVALTDSNGFAISSDVGLQIYDPSVTFSIFAQSRILWSGDTSGVASVVAEANMTAGQYIVLRTNWGGGMNNNLRFTTMRFWIDKRS